MMTRRDWFQRVALGSVGLAALVGAPGWVFSSTHAGRRLACEYLRQQYLDFTDRFGFSPSKIRVGRELYETFVRELEENERVIWQLPTAERQYAAWLPESFLFKGSVVEEYGEGWTVRLR